MGTVVALTPDRALAQRLEALQKAQRIRSKRAGLKLDLKRGRCSVVDVLAAPPGWADRMKVLDLLLAAPHVGRVKANKHLRHAGVSPSVTLAGLSERQRAALVALLGGQR